MNPLVSKTLLSAITWCERHHTATIDFEVIGEYSESQVALEEARSAAKASERQERVRWIKNAIVISFDDAEGSADRKAP